MRTSAALMIAASLTGCVAPAPLFWVRPGATPADFDRDAAQCGYEAAAATGNMPAGYTLRQQINMDIAASQRQSDLTVLCLAARGYRRQYGVTKLPPPATPVRMEDPKNRESAQQMVRDSACSETARVNGGVFESFEVFSAACDDGRVFLMKCSSGICAQDTPK
jgi:hypothetical protein